MTEQSAGKRAAYAPKREDGNHAYVREMKSWGRTTESVVWHPDLATAKRVDGYTRMRYASVRVRRATVDDLARLTPTDRTSDG